MRKEYSEPEHLERILAHLRRVREEFDAKKPARTGTPATTNAASPQPPQPGKDMPPQSVAPHAKPTVAAPAPGETAAGAAAPAMPHMPKGAADRLTAFVAGKQAARAIRASAPVAEAANAKSSIPQIEVQGELHRAIVASRQAFVATGSFSFMINIMMLAGPLFMLQVYDRVMTSGSMPTLIALSLLTAALYGAIGLLELVRSRLVVRIGLEIERRIGDRVFEASLRRSLRTPGSSLLALRELDGLRQFIAGPGPLTFFDAPWTPVYLFVIFLTHWALGVAALAGSALIILIAWASEVRTRAPLAEASKAAARSIELAETGQRNAEAITAMGMLGAYRGRWQDANGQSLGWQVLAADRLGSMSSISKALRLLLQSLMLAIGAALAIRGEISAGSIIAGTIIFGRAIAPVEQAVGQWRSLIKARESYEKLAGLLRDNPPAPERMQLPKPKGKLDVSNLRVAAPDSRTVILSGITFNIEPGRMLAVIGPSASGKSTLARALVGLWEPFGGQIRLDGARLDQWDAEQLGQHIGYLPQDVELFAGTVRENISRFRQDATDAEVVAAAKAAHAHDMIMALPQSYETQLGAFGTYLSAGQRQRIGLSRALFRDPALIVLDEPNSNLDRIGDEALAAAIDGTRARGQAIILVSHRVQAIGKADYLLYIERGAQRAFGPRADVLKYLQSGGLNQGTEVTAPLPAASARNPTPQSNQAPPVPAKPKPELAAAQQPPVAAVS